MSWAVGERDGRWIGYGVPAYCDQPECGAGIHRGTAYCCMLCGLFFCDRHLHYSFDEPDAEVQQYPGSGVCDRCGTFNDPYEPTEDHPDWVRHLLTDESCQQWRDENPDEVERLVAIEAETQ